MPIGAEVVRSIVGAARIALLDPAAPAWFNLTLQGFWRSFLAPVLLAPFFLLIVLLDASRAAEGEAAGALAIVRVLSYGFGVVAFPLLMVPMARLLRLGDTYVGYIIMWNWSAVPQNAVMMPITTLVAFDFVSDKSAAMVSMAAVLTVLFYGYLVARAGLRCPPLTAAGVVLLDFVLSLVINTAARSLAG